MVLRRRFLLLALLLGTAQAGGAGPSNVCGAAPVMDIAGVQRQLGAAQVLWQQRGPEEYGLTTEVMGQLSFTTTWQVRRGVVSGLSTVDSLLIDGQVRLITHREAPAFAQRYTVPGLFKYVELLLEGFWQPAPRPAPWSRPCGLLDVRFDPADGHLHSLRFDFFSTTDEEFTLTVSPVTPLP